MNVVNLIGRLTKDPEVRYTTGQNQMAVATFTIAIDRMGKEKQTDYPRITVFGRQAENCEKYLHKGNRVAIEGRIQTGSYEKDGRKIYTTDVIANRVEFIETKKAAENGNQSATEGEIPPRFEMLNDDTPF